MKKEIEIQNKKIQYTIRTNKKIKNLRLAIHCGGDFIVTSPKFLSISFIEKFIIQKSEWIIKNIEHFKKIKIPLSNKNSKLEFKKYKHKAFEIATKKVDEFNKIYNFKFNKINIKNQKTRWGSCSRKGNLNFNYKIAILPDRLANYLVVHEICHLKEFNHSKNFWNLVQKTLPDYKKMRIELKKIN